MNSSPDRRKLLWFAAIGGVLLLALLFVSVLAPSAHPGEESPILRPETTAAGSSATDGQLTGRPDSATTDASGEGGFSLSGGEVVSLAWRLALAAVTIGVSIIGLRWWGKRTQGPRSSTGFIRVVDTLAISNGRTIHLVALGDRVIAVGATTQQLTLLNELTDDEAAEVLTAVPVGPPGTQLSTFAAELFTSMRKRTDRPGSRAVRRETTIGER